jgi:hypothetical protein
MRPATLCILLLFTLALAVGWWFTLAGETADKALRFGLFGLLLGSAMLGLCWDALEMGRIRLRTLNLQRSARPLLFGSTVILYTAGGVLLIAVGLYALWTGRLPIG